LNPNIIDEEDKINLVTYCTFTTTAVEDGYKLREEGVEGMSQEEIDEAISKSKKDLGVRAVRQKILVKKFI
jgi:hypothetical protein